MIHPSANHASSWSKLLIAESLTYFCHQFLLNHPECQHHLLTVKIISYRSSAVRTLIGDEKISEIDSVVASGSKTCAAVYPAARCPWSPNTFKKIAYNAILDSDLDLGSFMSLAAKSFAS